MPRGRFISFEGGEGCGKSTQVRLLAQRLELIGHTVLRTREPGGTEIGEQLRDLLQHSKAGQAMAPETELLLFTASRAQLVREVIIPALNSGAIVLADRFLDSTTVYQGVARRLDPIQVAAVNQFAVGDTLPDLTLILDVPPETAASRLKARNSDLFDRMESQPPEFHAAVRAGYRQLATSDSDRIRFLDASGPIDAVADCIWGEVARILPFAPPAS